MDEPIKVWTGYVRRSQLGPEGLCADKSAHTPHLHESPSLGRFWCTGDPADREPGRSERRRADRCPGCGSPPSLSLAEVRCLDPRHPVLLPEPH